jgi:hypothetical protein
MIPHLNFIVRVSHALSPDAKTMRQEKEIPKARALFSNAGVSRKTRFCS